MNKYYQCSKCGHIQASKKTSIETIKCSICRRNNMKKVK